MNKTLARYATFGSGIALIILAIVLAFILYLPSIAVGQTNSPVVTNSTPVIPDVFDPPVETNSVAVAPVAVTPLGGLKPLAALLTGKLGWVDALIAYLGTISTLLAGFSGKIQRFAFDTMNSIADTQSVDDDTYLRDLFSKAWYKVIAFVLLFVRIHLPTLPDLERTIAAQNQAVAEASNSKPASPGRLSNQ